MQERLRQHMELRGDLQRAVEEQEFIVFYQPVVELDTGRVTAVEALVRWMHPERGLVAPGEFISLAEDTGLIVPLERWLLREACSQVKAWEAVHPTLSMTVNVSARQLQEPRIVEDVAEALGDSGLAAGSLTLEITESVLMEDAEMTKARLQELKRLGVLLAIDFGTGYSSLGYLRRFPIDLIKVDRSFVSGLGGGRGEDALVRAIVRLGHSLNIRTLAEGIESPQQVRELRALGCRLGQGYLFSRPADADTIAALLANPATIEQTVASSTGGGGATKRSDLRLPTEFARHAT